MCQQTLWGRMLRAMNYKPGWWALYAVYVAIPIVAYIVCLVRRANEVYSYTNYLLRLGLNGI